MLMYVCKFRVSMLQKGQVFLTSNFLSPTLIFNSVASFIREWTFYFTNLRSVQLLSYVQLFLTPWTAAYQAFLSITTPGACLNSCPKVGDAIQPFHPLSSSSAPAFSLSQHQGLFQWVSSSHQVPKVLEFQLQQQSFQWIFRTDFL